MQENHVTHRCVTLLSGGLDSMLAIRIMQEQGVEVEALNFKTAFTCCQDQSGQAARMLGVRLTVVSQDDDYLELIKKPQFGFGKGANPCVDCRIYMFERAKHFMQQIGADFIVSGEVVGQRPMSQKKKDLRTISYHSDLEDLLLRPLSAKLPPPTLPEREGWVNRDDLYDFYGRGRKKLIQLAKSLGIEDIPSPSTGCALTEPKFSQKVFDLVRKQPSSQPWDFELLKVGRHFRLDDETKVVVGRRESENGQLEFMHSQAESTSTAVLRPENFQGPAALIVGPTNSDSMNYASGLVLRYANALDTTKPQVEILTQETRVVVTPVVDERIQNAKTLAD